MGNKQIKVDYFTGADAQMFGQASMLLQCFDDMEARTSLKVCDFGLNTIQRQFLEQRGQLAVIPALPPEKRHPYYQKSCLVKFAVHSADAIVWIDADMISNGDLRPIMSDVVTAMDLDGQCIAAAVDSANIDQAGFLQWAERQGHDVAPFRRQLSKWSIDLSHPYFNAGFFVATSREWLKDWNGEVFDNPPYVVFDQNSLNVMAWRSPKSVRVLDHRVWNVHGHLLGRVQCDATGDSITCGGATPVMFHATSEDKSHHKNLPVKLDIAGRASKFIIKVFRNEKLRKKQLDLLARFVQKNPIAGLYDSSGAWGAAV